MEEETKESLKGYSQNTTVIAHFKAASLLENYDRPTANI
jgi:hypothetical protein